MDARLSVMKTIEEHALIAKGDRVLLGLSGGPDSLCLLDILAGLRKKYGFELFCLHLNHKIRGEEAEEDARWLAAYCEGRGLPLAVAEADVPAEAKRSGKSLEEAGRDARAQALRREAERLGGAKIALAHNRDDQAETVLMRIIRGTGIRGLKGMEYEAGGVIRPLLDTPRSLIEDYVSAKRLEPRIDSTNASQEYTRNRIRHDLIAHIEKEYNPEIKDALVRLARGAAEQDELAGACAAAFAARSIKREGGCLSVAGRAARGETDASLKLALTRAFAELGLEKDIGAAHLNSLVRAIRTEASGQVIEFPHGYRAEIRRGSILLIGPER